jgi:predicted dehydrogenase
MGSGEVVERDTPDHFSLIGRHANGCVSIVEVIGGHPPSIPYLFGVSGDAGELAVNGALKGSFQTDLLNLTSSLDLAPPAEPVVPGLAGPGANIAELYTQLAQTIRTGDQHGHDFEFAATLTRMLAAIERAAKSGQRLRLDAKARVID